MDSGNHGNNPSFPPSLYFPQSDGIPVCSTSQPNLVPSTYPALMSNCDMVYNGQMSTLNGINSNFFGYWNQDSYFNNFQPSPLHSQYPLSSTSPYASSSNYTSPVGPELPKKKKKQRVLFKAHQVKAMEEIFKITKNPNSETKKRLEARTGLGPKQVKIWFQNRRYKEKIAAKERAAKQIKIQSKSSSPKMKDEDDDLPAVYDQNMNYNPNIIMNPGMNLNMINPSQQENFWYNPQFPANWTHTQPAVYPQPFPPQFNNFTGYEHPPMFPAYESPESDETKSDF